MSVESLRRSTLAKLESIDRCFGGPEINQYKVKVPHAELWPDGRVTNVTEEIVWAPTPKLAKERIWREIYLESRAAKSRGVILGFSIDYAGTTVEPYNLLQPKESPLSSVC